MKTVSPGRAMLAARWIERNEADRLLPAFESLPPVET
jgi:hypothetical protein